MPDYKFTSDLQAFLFHNYVSLDIIALYTAKVRAVKNFFYCTKPSFVYTWGEVQ